MREAGSILENQEYHMTNVLSFRKKMAQAELQREMERIGRFVTEGGYQKTAPTVTTTYAVEQQGQLLDTEVLIPLDKPFAPPEGCVCKPVFRLVNAVSIRHIGNPAGLQETCNRLLAYVQQKSLVPITNGYNVTVQEAKIPSEMDQMIVDVYIGISPNTL